MPLAWQIWNSKQPHWSYLEAQGSHVSLVNCLPQDQAKIGRDNSSIIFAIRSVFIFEPVRLMATMKMSCLGQFGHNYHGQNMAKPRPRDLHPHSPRSQSDTRSLSDVFFQTAMLCTAVAGTTQEWHHGRFGPKLFCFHWCFWHLRMRQSCRIHQECYESFLEGFMQVENEGVHKYLHICRGTPAGFPTTKKTSLALLVSRFMDGPISRAWKFP